MRYVVLLLSLLIYSCKSYIPITEKTTETVTIRDTVVMTESDSAMILAYLECDSLGNVFMREIERRDGRMQVGVSIINNRLKVDAYLPAVPIKVQIPERMIVVERDKPVEIIKKPWYTDILIAISLILLISFSWRRASR